MKLAVLAALTLLFAPACVAPSTTAPASASVAARFDAFVADQRSLLDAGSRAADSDEDERDEDVNSELTLEESAALASVEVEFDPEDVGPDLIGLARALVFARSLDAGELGEVERLARGPRIRGLEFVFVHVFLERSCSHAAARAVLQGLAAKAPADPASNLGRWWEYNFGGRADQSRLWADLALALVDVAEAPDATPLERELVAKLYAVERLDAATCAALRARIRSSIGD